MRISDSERQRAVEELRRHSRAGRIDLEDFGRRVEAVLAAGTLDELDRVFADLPRMTVAHLDATGRDGPASSSWPARLAVLVAVLVAVAVVAAVVVAQVVWAVVIAAVWAAGMLQLRLRGRS